MIAMATPTAESEKLWPTKDELLSWFIWHKLETRPIGEYERAENVHNWVCEFNDSDYKDVHEYLYSKYVQFADKFRDPMNEEGSYV